MPTHIPVESVTDEIAESIKNIDDAMKKMGASGLTDKAIVVLLQNIIGPKNITQRDIENVLWGLRNLKREFLK